MTSRTGSADDVSHRMTSDVQCSGHPSASAWRRASSGSSGLGRGAWGTMGAGGSQRRRRGHRTSAGMRRRTIGCWEVRVSRVGRRCLPLPFEEEDDSVLGGEVRVSRVGRRCLPLPFEEEEDWVLGEIFRLDFGIVPSAGATPSDRLPITQEIEGLDGPRLVPKIVQQCIKYLEANGLHTVGIFRVGPSRKRVRELREDLDHGRDLSPSGHHCPHDVAAIMKEYFRDLPDPLLTKELYQAFIHTQRVLQASLQVQILRGLIQLLPPCNQDTLECLLRFLNKVSRNADDIRTRAGDFIVGNKMDSHNLATLFAPNVFHPPDLGATEEATAERLDAINTLRSMIDQDQELFKISPDLLHGIYLRLLEKSPGSLELIFRGKIASHLEECDPDLLDAEPLLESYTSDCSRSATVGDIPMLLRWKLGRGPAPEGVRRERSGRDETGTPSPSSSLPRRPKEEDGGGWFRRRDKSSSTTASGGREASLSSISSSGGDVTPVLSGPLSDENRQRWFRRGKEDKRLRRERSKTQGDIVYSAPDSAFQQYHHLTGEAAKSTSESEISTIHRPLLLSSSMPVDQRQRSSSDKTITSSQYQQLPLGEDGQARFVTRTAGLLVPQAVDVSRRRSSPELDAPPLLGSSGGGGLFTSSLRVPVRYQSPDIPFIELGAEEMTATADLPSPPPRGPPAESPAPPKKGGPHLHAADHASAGGGHSTLARFFSTSEAPSDPTEKRAEVKGPPPVSTEKRTEVKGPPPVSTEKRTEVKGAPPVSRSATTSSVPHIKKGGGSLRKKEGGARKEAPPPSAVGVEGVASSSSSSGKWKRYTLSWSISELERSAHELEREIQELEERDAEEAGNEWKVRFATQQEVNKQLEKQQEWLAQEVARHQKMLTEGLEVKMKAAAKKKNKDIKLAIGIMMNRHYVDLDRYAERELARLELQMQRQRNYLNSALRDTEWNLDRKSSEYHHLDELRESYRTETHQLDLIIQKLRAGGILDEKTGKPIPVTSTNRRLDTVHLPVKESSNTLAIAKSPQKKIDSATEETSSVSPASGKFIRRKTSPRKLPTLKVKKNKTKKIEDEIQDHFKS
ncbi:unnamed protein product [Cyprideis torosa]|uniref:Uncharacterized protein n=1 Tax=Cyprideis torosa TaxID=163714 RepID=A0A7R8ZJE3_9CRUS|nr:unnamed protein product [Cyprideis torosa]CAG0886768.1 unnamed protein product [Cyprideis torosa]